MKKRNYFAKYEGAARTVLETLLDKYADEGLPEIESQNILRMPPLNQLGTPSEVVEIFGGKENYRTAVNELKKQIYSAA